MGFESDLVIYNPRYDVMFMIMNAQFKIRSPITALAQMLFLHIVSLHEKRDVPLCCNEMTAFSIKVTNNHTIGMVQGIKPLFEDRMALVTFLPHVQ